MATETIKNIPEPIYARIKAQAKANHRNINGEILSMLEQAVSVPLIDVQAIKQRWPKKFLPKIHTGLFLHFVKMNFAMFWQPIFAAA